MPSPFTFFDVYPHEIRLITGRRSAGYDANGLRVAPSTTTTAITGHFSVFNREERAHRIDGNRDAQDIGRIEDGTIRFYSDTPLHVGDIIEADQDTPATLPALRYEVQAIVNRGHLIAQKLGTTQRYEAFVKEVPL